jgi:cation:H+ antiporter
VLFDALVMFGGLALLIAGGEALVRGASNLAQDLGVSPLAVGLTVVAFGTSAPELAVNTTAALEGNTSVSFGNVIGSNLANVGLVLGCAALVRPLVVEGVVISREIPMMLLASAAALILGLDRLRGAEEAYDRSDGLMLLLLFVVFLYYTIAEILRRRISDPFVSQAEEAISRASLRSVAVALAMLGTGLVALAGGAHWTVQAAVSIAEDLHVPRVVIGLTLVAVGTSLPELVTSGMAAWRGKVDLAVGNVVGSNLFNLLFVLGVTATIRPIPTPESGAWDLLVMAGLSVGLLVLAIRRDRRIVRTEGAVLCAVYVAYLGWRVSAS